LKRQHLLELLRVAFERAWTRIQAEYGCEYWPDLRARDVVRLMQKRKVADQEEEG
jgi:hypothetical protein